jgi:N-acetylglutamate synthase-like GNAT family acetyltransferase/DNA-binding MarR family transcriptional regulator
MRTPTLLRDLVREYVRSQRRTAHCGDTASTVECHILTELLCVELCTQQELADRLMLDKGWISRGVDRLAERGQVTRTPDPSDKRRVQLRLAPAGRERATALDAQLAMHATSLVNGFSAEEEHQLAALLSKLLASLRADRDAAPCKAEGEGVRYRQAGKADWPAIEALLREARLPVEGAADHLGHFTVGVNRTGLVAVGGFEPYGADALLRSFAVAETARNRAHGSELLRHVLLDARQSGIETAFLLTQTAEGFFSRHGFKAIERNDAPLAIRQSREFSGLCPASARLMAQSLSSMDDTER